MTEESATSPDGTIVWFEVPAADTARARAFYGGVFGWAFEQFGDSDYHVTDRGDGAVYGAPAATGVLAYFGVADIEASAARVAEHGGSAGDRQEIPGVGFYVHCADPDGNPFGLYQGLPS